MTAAVPKKSPASAALPSFRQPPINEVVCGFRYEPLQALKVPHIGCLWERFRSEYPETQHATPLATDTNILVDASTGAPLPRVWFVSEDESQLIQFQADRFYFNWRERGTEYPRYSHIIQRFESARAKLDAFVADFNLGHIVPVEYELTYFNQIPRGEGWDSNDDLNQVFRDFNWTADPKRFLPNPSVTTWQARFALPDEAGLLAARLSQGKRRTDDKAVLVLELSAKGIGKDSSEAGVRAWYDTAREWIVRGFADLTTDKVQQTVWEREHD